LTKRATSSSLPSSQVPDKIQGVALAALLRPRFLGASLTAIPSSVEVPTSVVWVDGGDSVLVHLDSIATRIVGTCLLVSIDLETDQTGRTPLVVAFAINATDAAGLVAATDALPRGNGILASRWGSAVRNAAWGAFLRIASDHATERGGAPYGFSIANNQLTLSVGPRPTLG
jgi:hypothetical protein